MLKTVGRALQLLNILGVTGEMTLGELARELGTNKQDAFRLVKTLVDFQFVSRNSRTGKVKIGIGFTRLADLIKPSFDLRQIALSALTQLRDKTGETACLHIMSGDSRACILQVESKAELRCVAKIGKALPLTTGSAGRVFLAHMPDLERVRLLKRLTPLTPESVVDLSRVNRMIRNAQRDGYAIARNETVLGMAACSAPVFDLSGNAIAAVTILGPSQRLTKSRLIGFSGAVREAARCVSIAIHGEENSVLKNEKLPLRCRPDRKDLGRPKHERSA
jgi:DNA-binding IclR family transcriptional regulator